MHKCLTLLRQTQSNIKYAANGNAHKVGGPRWATQQKSGIQVPPGVKECVPGFSVLPGSPEWGAEETAQLQLRETALLELLAASPLYTANFSSQRVPFHEFSFPFQVIARTNPKVVDPRVIKSH
ncbi:hypothetical protein RRG08_004140 [Elysia crispata]|uniref:Uncharacterized protein n=1 Tax=Elysia crispata TaxID=231223 RepID=A0AAE0YW75_9GAST|nr:hypothetical protein RRG08_004140 [Elysia crispata]